MICSFEKGALLKQTVVKFIIYISVMTYGGLNPVLLHNNAVKPVRFENWSGREVAARGYCGKDSLSLSQTTAAFQGQSTGTM